VPDDGGAILVADGDPIRADEVRGVFVRLPHVAEAELGAIASHDRAYVAAECQAFLYAMLSALRCPVFNRPTPNCLAGRFIRTARGKATHYVSVIGDRAFGEPALHEPARAFSRAVGLTLARVWFDEEQPLTADLWPDCMDADIRHAILELWC
jgi:hypothetical protein